MNDIMQVNHISKTMSSREIAELTGKRHDHVCRDIELLNETLAQESLPKVGESIYVADNGQSYREYLLSKEQTIDLMTGYNRNLRVRINRRWQELEQQVQASSPVMPALPNFTDPYESALAWAEQYKAKEVAQAQVIELQPKAAALDTLSHAKGSLGIREAANTVGIPERKFIARCTDENKPVTSRFMYRDDKNKLRAYSHRIKQGFMTQKITSYAGKNGHDLVTVQVKFTAAGVAHIAKMMQNKPAKQLRVMQ